MNSYLNGAASTVTIEFVDEGGNALTATAAAYRVTDETGVELVAQTNVPGFATAEQAIIQVTGTVNTLPSDKTEGIRVIEVFATVDGNTMLFSESYLIEKSEVLVKGINSYQSYSEAELVTRKILKLDGWNAATKEQRITAMQNARTNIGQLSFRVLVGDDDVFLRQYAGWGAFALSWKYGINDMTQAEFLNLPPQLLEALALAQVAEADALLGGDPIDDIRRDGLMSKTVGESSQMYRAGKPLMLPVSRRALQYLSRHITYSKRIGRS